MVEILLLNPAIEFLLILFFINHIYSYFLFFSYFFIICFFLKKALFLALDYSIFWKRGQILSSSAALVAY